MTYIVYSEKDELRFDFAIKLANELKKEKKITIIDLDSKNRDLAIKLGVAEFTIYDVEDCLMGLVNQSQAEIKVDENLYLISASIIDKYEYDEFTKLNFEDSIVLIKDKEKLKYFTDSIFSISDSPGEFPGMLVAYNMDKKQLKEISKNNKLVAINQDDYMIENALKGEKIEYKGFLDRILSIFNK